MRKFNKNQTIYLLLILLVITTFKYHFRYNENKKFMELENINLSGAVDAELLDKKLSGLKWITKKYFNNPQFEINKLIDIKKIMANDKNNKILISDHQVLPALIDNKNFAPNKWFDPLSIPGKKNKYFQIYQNFFLLKLKEQNIVNVYVVESNKLKIFQTIFIDHQCFKKTVINEMGIMLNITKCFN